MASSTRIPTASAKPPSVITLIVSPISFRQISEVKIDRGIEIAIMAVVRQFPRKSSSMTAVRPAAIRASWTTPEMAAFTKTDWSASSFTSTPSGSSANSVGSFFLMSATTSSVEALPFLSAERINPRSPFWRTTLVWGEYPSRT